MTPPKFAIALIFCLQYLVYQLIHAQAIDGLPVNITSMKPTQSAFHGPTRIAPGNRQVTLDWEFIAEGSERSTIRFKIQYKSKIDDKWEKEVVVPGTESSFTITDLVSGEDYCFRILVEKIGTPEPIHVSPERIVRPGIVPGVVINYIHPDDHTYMPSGRSPASPSIVILPGGDYVASHDIFWGGAAQNLTKVFLSQDRGITWKFLADLQPCFWGKLFVHRGSLYMLSTSTEYGAILIRRSDDGGKTWSAPISLLAGGDRKKGGPHKAPVPVIVHNGRIWSGIEYGSWSLGGHDAGVISAPTDANLLDPSSWTVSGFLPACDTWPGAVNGASFLEGNIVYDVRKDKLVNILRYNTEPVYRKAVMLDVNEYDPAAAPVFNGVIDFYGGMSKFTIRYDERSDLYWSLVNRVTRDFAHQRNVLTLVSSPDLIHWKIENDILNYADKDTYTGNRKDMKIGFQYVDWQFDGEDIVAVSRTAINGAYNYHNANYLTFHRIERFRQPTH